jgi:hypothetical protein
MGGILGSELLDSYRFLIEILDKSTEVLTDDERRLRRISSD